MNMSPKERIMMLRLYEKVSKNKEYAEKIGVEIVFDCNDEKSNNSMTTKTQ